MGLSHITRMPELSGLNIPAQQYNLRLSDDIIFRSLLNRKRSLAVRQGPAVRGDYVLAEAVTGRGSSRVHVELGGGSFPELESALMGCEAGQERSADINGAETVLRVESVKRVVDMPLTDEAIAALGLPGVGSLTDYRREYIRRHGAERAERVFKAIQQRLLNRLTELAGVYLEPAEVEHYHERQRAMIRNISGDLDQRLMDAYGCATPEECDRLFFADNRRTFIVCLYGRALAERDGRRPSEDERRSALEYYGLIYDMDPEEIAAAGLEDEALQSFYIQYGIGAVRAYYYSLVRFSAEGISAQAIGE